MEQGFREAAVAEAKDILSKGIELNTHQALAQGKAVLERLRNCQRVLSHDVETEEAVASDKDSSEEEMAVMAKRFASDKRDLAIAGEAIGKLEPLIAEAEKRLSVVFNKYRAFSNIRELLKTSDVKLGQIEREAGLQPGYMSRLEKIDNTTEPTVEFLFTAARLLKVPVDYLLKGSVTSVTPTENYILEFLDKLISETQEGLLFWQRETAKELSNVEVLDKGRNRTAHPLFNVGYEELFENYFSVYNSRFYKEEPVVPTGTSYNASINDSRHTVYIMDCSLDGTSYGGAHYPEYYEVYLVDVRSNNQVVPLFCTTRSCGAVNDRLNSLVESIRLAELHVQVDQRARSIIDEYLVELPF